MSSPLDIKQQIEIVESISTKVDITDISKFNYCIIKEVYNIVYLNYQNGKITKER